MDSPIREFPLVEDLMEQAMSLPQSEQSLRQQETAQSMKSLVFQQFLQHRMAVAGGVVIIFLCLTALCAPLISWVTGLDPDRQNVAARYLHPFQVASAPPDQRETQIERWIENHPAEAAVLQTELVEKELMNLNPEDTLYELGAMDIPSALQVLASAQAPARADFEALLKSFETFHVFGTDELGRDVLIRLIYGARVSIGVGVVVALAAGLIGFLIGSLAGFYGGFLDAALMRVTDALLSLPLIPVLIIFAAIDLTKIPWLYGIISGGNQSIVKMILIFVLFSWMTVARLVRGSILSLREREFILAARTLGAKDRTIIFRHMFPNVIAPMLVSITLGVGESILFEASLSFLGLGIMPPTPSWGNMLNNAQEVIYNNMWLAILPGLLILITVVSFNFFGDGLQDAMDPKSIRR